MYFSVTTARIILILFLSVLVQQPVNAQAKINEKEIDSYVAPYVQADVFSGNILVASNNKVVFYKGYGYANREWKVPFTIDTKFQIASISKLITDVVLIKLQEEGLLKVTDTVSKYLKGIPNGNIITIRHLIFHLSGISGDFADMTKYYTPEQVLDTIRNLAVTPPTAGSRYSNHNYRLLSAIMEKASGMSYGQLLKQKLFDPLKMYNTGHSNGLDVEPKMASGYVPDGFMGVARAIPLDWRSKTGNGSVFSTVEDLLKLNQALHYSNFLSKSSYEFLLTLSSPTPIDGKKAFSINGGAPGFAVSFDSYLDDKVCVIVLSNNYAPLSRATANDIGAMYFGKPYIKTALINPNIKVDKTSLEKFTGTYQYGQDFYQKGWINTITYENGHLYVNARGTSTILIPLGGNTFLDRMNWAEITFIPKKDSDEIESFETKIYRKNLFVAKKIK